MCLNRYFTNAKKLPGHVHLQKTGKQLWSKLSQSLRQGQLASIRWQYALGCDNGEGGLLVLVVVLGLLWEHPGPKTGWCAVFSSPAPTGVWLQTFSDMVYPLPFLWGLCVTTVLLLLSVFIPHNLWLSKKDLLFKKKALWGRQPLTLLRNPASYQEPSAAAVEKTLHLRLLTGANQIVRHLPACPKGKQAKNLNQ